MSKALRTSLTGLWIVVASGLLARWWYAHPDLFPRFPQKLWGLFDRWYGAESYEAKTDVELVVVLLCSLAAVSVLTLLVYVAIRKVIKE